MKETIILSPSPELSYVIGAFLGDGWKQKRKNMISGIDYQISLAAIDRDFVEKFSDSIIKVLNRKPRNIYEKHRPNRQVLYTVTYGSKQLYTLLEYPLDEVIKVASPHPKSFLQGFYDAEGYVAIGKNNSIRVGLSNSNLKMLNVSKNLLESEFGIRARIEKDTSRKKYKKAYKLILRSRDDIMKFKKLVNFSIKRKAKKIKVSGGQIFLN